MFATLHGIIGVLFFVNVSNLYLQTRNDLEEHLSCPKDYRIGAITELNYRFPLIEVDKSYKAQALTLTPSSAEAGDNKNRDAGC